MSDKFKKLDDFLNEEEGTTQEGTVCDMDGNCRPKHIKHDKSIVERVNKKVIIEDGRQLLF